MSERNTSISRRSFVKISTVAAVSAQLYPVFAGNGNNNSKSRIVRIHDPNATRPWIYSANAPWDHTVEPRDDGTPGKIKERYFDYINENIVGIMLDRGLCELTDMGSASDAWGSLLPNLQKSDRITIKMNMNNASFDPQVTTNRMDQTIPLVNVILDDLVGELGLSEENITILDASRWFHPEIMKGRCRYKHVQWVDETVKERWDRNESVTFTKDNPEPGGDFWMPKAYTQADHIINLCLMKSHGCGISGL